MISHRLSGTKLGERSFISESEHILDNAGLHISPELRGKYNKINEIVNGIKLIAWKFNLPY